MRLHFRVCVCVSRLGSTAKQTVTNQSTHPQFTPISEYLTWCSTNWMDWLCVGFVVRTFLWIDIKANWTNEFESYHSRSHTSSLQICNHLNTAQHQRSGDKWVQRRCDDEHTSQIAYVHMRVSCKSNDFYSYVRHDRKLLQSSAHPHWMESEITQEVHRNDNSRKTRCRCRRCRTFALGTRNYRTQHGVDSFEYTIYYIYISNCPTHCVRLWTLRSKVSVCVWEPAT